MTARKSTTISALSLALYNSGFAVHVFIYKCKPDRKKKVLTKKEEEIDT